MEIINIKVSKLSIVSNPATKLHWIKKSENEDNPDLVEVTAALKDFFPADEFDPAELRKSTDKEDLLEAISMLKPFRENMPQDLEDGINLLVKCAASAYDQEKEEEEVEEFDPDNPYPSVPLIVPSHMLEKSDEELEEEDAEHDDELDADPVVGALRRIEKKLNGSSEPKDDWPSLDAILPRTKSTITEPKPIKKVDPLAKEKPVKKSIDRMGDDEGIFLEKDSSGDEEDCWPSVISPMDMGVVPKG